MQNVQDKTGGTGGQGNILSMDEIVYRIDAIILDAIQTNQKATVVHGNSHSDFTVIKENVRVCFYPTYCAVGWNWSGVDHPYVEEEVYYGTVTRQGNPDTFITRDAQFINQLCAKLVNHHSDNYYIRPDGMVIFKNSNSSTPATPHIKR